MALSCSWTSARCSYHSELLPGWRPRHKNVALQSGGSGRGSLQVCGLRREPAKKFQYKEDLLMECKDETNSYLTLKRESTLRYLEMRHFEVMFLVHQDKVGELESIIRKYTSFVRNHEGRIWRLNDWGMRRLAYKIQRTWRAHYILMNFELAANRVQEFDFIMSKDPKIIRHLVIKRKKAHTEKTFPPPEIPMSIQESRDQYRAYLAANMTEEQRQKTAAKRAERLAKKEAAIARAAEAAAKALKQQAVEAIDREEAYKRVVEQRLRAMSGAKKEQEKQEKQDSKVAVAAGEATENVVEDSVGDEGEEVGNSEGMSDDEEATGEVVGDSFVSEDEGGNSESISDDEETRKVAGDSIVGEDEDIESISDEDGSEELSDDGKDGVSYEDVSEGTDQE